MRRGGDALRHPTIVGDLDRVEASGDGRYRVWGDLTLHGSTRQVEAEVRVDVHAQRILAEEWHQLIDIREFDVKPPRILMLRVHPEAPYTWRPNPSPTRQGGRSSSRGCASVRADLSGRQVGHAFVLEPQVGGVVAIPCISGIPGVAVVVHGCLSVTQHFVG